VLLIIFDQRLAEKQDQRTHEKFFDKWDVPPHNLYLRRFFRRSGETQGRV
jgi:hypothetical protein